MKDVGERDVMKQTMLEQDAVFKNQVHELHRLYRVQRNLVGEGKGINLNEDMNSSDQTSENASQRQVPGFLLPNSTHGEGSRSQASNGPLQNGSSSKDGDVRRRMIDLRLPAEEYLDTNSQKSSGSCLDVKNSNGLADLNEPLKWHESEPVALSRDAMYPHYGHWLEKNRSQNAWTVPEAGHDRSTQRNQLQHLPSYSAQLFPNNAFQPQSYLTTDDHSKAKFSVERAFRNLEARSKNPQVSYESSVASNAPRSHNVYRPEVVRPWIHSSSSRENPISSSHQRSYPAQTSPFMNFGTPARADSSSEMRSHVSNGLYQGFPSVPKQSFFNFPSNASVGEVVKSRQGPTMQERSAGLPWLKPKPPYKSEISNGCFDLNASSNQFMGGRDDLTSGSSQKGLRSASYSNNANMGRVQMINPQSSIFAKQEHKALTSHSSCVADPHKEVNPMVKWDLNINMPCDASVSVDQHSAKGSSVKKGKGIKAANSRRFIDLNSRASDDGEDSGLQSSVRVKAKVRTWIDLEAPPTLESEEGDSSRDGNSMDDELIKVAAQAIVAISSSSNHRRHPDDAASSSTDAAKDTLSWFADIITCSTDESKRKADGSPQECSSGKIDYFVAMTLNLQPTKEEDYMPEPLVPENLKFEETATNGPRRGQARRGRSKQDFLTDILPGLPSLSRKEVTEDMQTFDGLVKKRNYSWKSRIGGRRNSKRRRHVSNISQAPVCPSMAKPKNESVSVVELEDSKLAGWGQATRRTRRQRCPPAGSNPSTVTLT